MSGAALKLHDYWRSTASYRVRIALEVKGLTYERATHDLRVGAQRDPAFLAIAPQGLMPALDVGEVVLTQSLAILEWLEERHPQPPLLPARAVDRAVVRAMALTIACDMHPLNNLRVLQALRSEFGATADHVETWIARWTGEGFFALEASVARYGGDYAFGDSLSLADCCLVPQVYSARRFNVDLGPFPRVCAVAERAAALPAFAAAHPSRQPGADLA